MRRILLVVMLPALAACGAATETTPTVTEPNDSVESTTTSALGPRTTTSRAGQGDGSTIPEWFVDQGVLPPALEARVRKAVAERAGVDPAAVVLTGSMFMQWPNSALGCPQKGEMSLQVLTDGFLAYFAAGGVTYRAHTDLDTSFRICDLFELPEPSPQR
jgi:hypothetical protein